MISKTDLKDFGRIKGLNLRNTEKDYLLDIALLNISRHTKNELIFKGGTCLYKFHNLQRFSEDLDFSCVKKLDIKKLFDHIILDFEKFGIKAEIKKIKEPFNSILASLKLEGPLFAGNHQSSASIGIDINLKSEVLLGPELLSFTPLYQDIPKISILCMKKEEILAEKVRAILTRNKARDLFDLHFLINQRTKINPKLIEKKLEYYNKKFNLKEFKEKIIEKKLLWEKELKFLTANLPNFKQASQETIKAIKKKFNK